LGQVPVVRASKVSAGTFFPQGTNLSPGRPGFPVEVWRDGEWHTYSDTAERRYVVVNLQRFV
jgi:hypothetical protein